MKTFLALLSFFVTITLYSQDCNYTKNKVDDFTGERIIQTQEKNMVRVDMSGNFIRMSALKIDDQRFLDVTIYSMQVFSIKKNNALMIRTEDGEVVELKFTGGVVADYKGSGNMTQWFASNLIPLNKELYDKLKSVRPDKMRWYLSDGYHEKVCKKRHTELLQEMLACIE